MCNEREYYEYCGCKGKKGKKKILLSVFGCLLLLCIIISPVQALVYSKVKIKVNSTVTTTTIPNSVLWNREKIDKFFKLRPDAESWGFQAGYYRAIDDIKLLLGMSISKYSTAPSLSVQETDLKYCLPYKREGYWFLNTTNNRHIQIINSNPNKKSPYWNVTQVQIWKK